MSITTESRSAAEVLDAFSQVRATAGKTYFTNYFSQPHSNEPYPMLRASNAALFLDKDHDFFHILFAASSPAALLELLRALPAGRYTLDYLTKEPNPALPQQLQAAGFGLLATYQRIAAPFPKIPNSGRAPDFAREEEMPGLHQRFPTLFDARLDHLPSLQALEQLAANRQILVNRNSSGEIAGFFIFQVQGIRGHLNFWWNPRESGPQEGLNLLIHAYHEMKLRGVKQVHAWVNVLNARVIQVHRHFGLVPDGLWNYIHVYDALPTAF